MHKYLKGCLHISLFDLGLFYKLLDLWTLLEVFLLGIQFVNNGGGEGVLPTIEVLTETVASTPNCLTPTETLLSNHSSTDMKPYVIVTVTPLEVFTILGVC